MSAIAGGRNSRGGRSAGFRAQWRRAWFGFLTLSGLAPRGHFIPYRYSAGLPPAGTRESYGPVETALAARGDAFQTVLHGLAAYRDDLMAIGEAPAPAPRWRQSWFPRLDAAVAYSFLRDLKPRRVVEVGSGHSTRFLCQAAADGELAIEITAIDPAPRASLASLPVTLRRQTLQQAGTAPFESLQSGDFLMIDSSHILMPGSDVDCLLGRVLPALPRGVVVQIHDIFLPDDYPPDWDWRGYNEQQGVLPLITGQDWEVLFASHYCVTRLGAALAESLAGELPKMAEARESSLWLRKL